MGLLDRLFGRRPRVPEKQKELNRADEDKKDGIGQTHAFRTKTFKKPRPCQWCHQPIVSQGSCCRVCKYVCHPVCENKGLEINNTTGNNKIKEAARFSDTSWQIHKQWSREGRVLPVSSQPHKGAGNQSPGTPVTPITPITPSSAPPRVERDGHSIYDTLTPRAESAPVTPGTASSHEHQNGFLLDESSMVSPGSRLDISYIAERLLALWLPAHDRQAEQQAQHMLKTKHGDHFMVFEINSGGGTRSPRTIFGPRVKSLKWSGELAPPLELICSACKELDRWLGQHPKNVAVLLAWGLPGARAALAVCVSAYARYGAVCGALAQAAALDRLAMRRHLERLGAPPPSARRLVAAFAALLAGAARVRTTPLLLTHATVAGAPSGHCFLKLYEGLTCVYTSGVYAVGPMARQWTASVAAERRAPLSLRGDVLLRCYRKAPSHNANSSDSSHPADQRELLFACQFHTCAVAEYTLGFAKSELDFACDDPRFPPDAALELHFEPPEGEPGSRSAPAPTPAAPLRAPPDRIARYDSLERLRNSRNNDDDACDGGEGESSESATEGAHTFGPLDGSIYATVQRRDAPRSPLSASMDSGISSAGRVRASPPDGGADADATPTRDAAAAELDALLGDMLQTASALPDAPAAAAQCSADRRAPSTPSARDDDIPYHARSHSRPFTYGAPGLEPGMLRSGARLSSPELVRRALGGRRPSSRADRDRERDEPPPSALRRSHSAGPSATATLPSTTSNGAIQRLTRDELLTATARRPHDTRLNGNSSWLNGDHTWSRKTLNDSKSSRNDSWRPNDRSWNDSSKNNNSTSWKDSMKIQDRWHEIRRAPDVNGDVTNGSGVSLTWLQRQQQKLRDKKEARVHANRLPLEWSGTRTRHSASHRFDGYTSDTTAFADDDDDFSVPLHINTTQSSLRHSESPTSSPMLPSRTSSRKYMFAEKSTLRSWTSSPPPTIPGLLSLAEPLHNETLVRDESFSSWRSTPFSETDSPRAATPAFPTHPRTPYAPTPTPLQSRLPPRSPPSTRKERGSSPEVEYRTLNGSNTSPVIYAHLTSRRSSISSEPPQDVAPDRVRFARDTSRFWYKANISRDDAISILQRLEPGSFIVRDSNSFPGAFGLAVRIAGDPSSPNCVRHFLIEPASKGVRLRGCADEPTFGSLSALVYQHTVTPLALPTSLKLPTRDPAPAGGGEAAARAFYTSGAACSVLLLGAEGTEALTGPAAVRRAVTNVIRSRKPPHIVNFKVSSAGITLTDSTRRLFFRQHYPANNVSHCGLDPDDRRWSHETDENGVPTNKRVFAFVARSKNGDNQCHIFAELEAEQPASAIVSFVVKVLLRNNHKTRDIV